jgi:hypothetical protein
MRLETTNPVLARRFAECQTKAGSQDLFEKIFWQCYAEMRKSVKDKIAKNLEIEELQEGRMPDRGDYQVYIDRLDGEYFDYEEGGDFDKGDISFKSARIISAINYASNAASVEDFAEASYEALMALDEPEDFNLQFLMNDYSWPKLPERSGHPHQPLFLSDWRAGLANIGCLLVRIGPVRP